jgi:hypothetical protein
MQAIVSWEYALMPHSGASLLAAEGVQVTLGSAFGTGSWLPNCGS